MKGSPTRALRFSSTPSFRVQCFEAETLWAQVNHFTEPNGPIFSPAHLQEAPIYVYNSKQLGGWVLILSKCNDCGVGPFPYIVHDKMYPTEQISEWWGESLRRAGGRSDGRLNPLEGDLR